MQGKIIIAGSPQKIIITEVSAYLAMAQSGINLAMTPKAELTDLQKLELKEAFDEFDKVSLRLLYGYNKTLVMITREFRLK